MDLHDRAIETYRLDLDANKLLLLQGRKEPIQHPGFGPAIHARIDRMPVAKALRQRSPLAAVLGHIEDRIDYLEILVRDIAALARQERFDARKLLSVDFHPASISNMLISVNRP